MQKRVLLVSAAVAVLGLAAAVLGFVAEATKSKAFVGYVGQNCVYRRTPALFCGVAAAVLALTALAVATAASGGCLRRGGAPASGGYRRPAAVKLSMFAWGIVVVAVVMFLYGAAMNRGGTRGVSTSRRYGRGGYYYYGCTVLKSGVFATASVLAAAATACAVAAYVYFQRAEEPPALGAMPPPAHFVAPGVAMGQPQWAQPYPAPPSYPPPPMAYPAPPPPQYGGYGAKQPAGPA